MSERLDEHLGYVADRRRLELFRAAVAAVVKPGDIVADLGCGTGILGLAALGAGAAHVYAVDQSEMIHVARQAFERAGLAARGTFIQGRTFRVELPRRVDVAICDHVGYFGFDYGIIELLADARRRFLAPGGRLLPRRLRLRLAAVESQAARRLVDAWSAPEIPHEYHWLAALAANERHALSVTAAEILGPPAELASIDLAADHRDFMSWSCQLVAGRDGRLDGLAGWFECELAPGIWMSNAPIAHDAIRRPQAFLPIGEATAVTAGEPIEAIVMARPGDGLIAWSVTQPRTGRRVARSTFEAAILEKSLLARADPARVPVPSRAGRARAAILACCDGRRTAREIAELVLRDHPDLMPSPREAARFVAEVLAKDCE